MWSPERGFVYLGVKEIKVMYQDIEILGDRYEEQQRILQEINEELANEK